MMSGRRLRWAGRLDMFRKIPADFMEGSRSGSALSYFAMIIMLTLFLLESRAYFTRTTVTDLALDRHEDQRLRLNFNITMMDLKCDYAVIDVVSVLGTQQNVTSHIHKWHVDGQGIRQRYQGRNKDQHDIQLFDTTVESSIDELHADGVDAVNLDPETLEYALKEQEYVFVDFFASWCSHCQHLAPTWETLAEIMTVVAEDILAEHKDHEHFSEEEYEHAIKVAVPVMIGNVDCVVHEELCRQQGIMAYPTLRLFVDGKRWRAGDYRGDRTIIAMTDYLRQIEDVHKSELEKTDKPNVELAHKVAQRRLGLGKEGDGDDDMSAEEQDWAIQMKKRKERLHNSWVDAEHPGCQLSGHLLLDRVPGNFHIQARSAHHDIVPHMTNVSHIVHHLSMGEPPARKMIDDGKKVFLPDEAKKKLAPMDGNVYVTESLHEAYHHYLKAITTSIDGLRFESQDLIAYQILQSSQLAYYREDVVPEAKFVFDISPVAVAYRQTSRHWYDYVTSVMAIVGGTFTVVGMIESSIHAVVARKRRY